MDMRELDNLRPLGAMKDLRISPVAEAASSTLPFRPAISSEMRKILPSGTSTATSSKDGAQGSLQLHAHSSRGITAGKAAPPSPPQNGNEEVARPKMSRSQARRHRRDILRQVKNNPEGAQEYIKQKKEKLQQAWLRQQQEAAASQQHRGPRSPKGPRAEPSEQVSWHRLPTGDREDSLCTGSSGGSDSGVLRVSKSSSATDRGLDFRTSPQHTVKYRLPHMVSPGRTSSGTGSSSDLPRLAKQKGSERSQRARSGDDLRRLEYELALLKVRKAEAEAEAEKAKGDAYMLARQTEALQQEKQEEAVKVQELQNTIEMLSERLVYWEGLNTEADEFSHDHLEGHPVELGDDSDHD